MRVLVFQPTVVGHYLEYLHHLFLMANWDLENDYVFVVPPTFDANKHLFEWSMTQNITIVRLTDDEESYLMSTGNLLKDSYRVCKITKSYASKHSCKTVFSANIVTYCPMAPFILGNKYNLIGIIYKIYLYGDKTSALATKVVNRIKYILFSKFGVFKKILVLNDEESANTLNDIYSTQKFTFVPDPFVPLDDKKIIDIRDKYRIPFDKKILVHFGGLSKRKGTHIILDSIDYLSPNDAKDFVFIFAGIAGDSIKNYITKKIEDLQDKTTIIFENRFCEYEYLAGLCKCCDAILIPYQQTDLSSGLLGYANQFGKPVVGPNSGLIANLIERFHLGVTINASSAIELAKEYSQIDRIECDKNSDYCRINSVSSFINKITEALKDVVN